MTLAAVLFMPDALPEWGDVKPRPFEPLDVEMVIDLATDPYIPLITTLPADADPQQAADWLNRRLDPRHRSPTPDSASSPLT